MQMKEKDAQTAVAATFMWKQGQDAQVAGPKQKNESDYRPMAKGDGGLPLETEIPEKVKTKGREVPVLACDLAHLKDCGFVVPPPFDMWTPEQAVTITEGKKNSKGKLDWSRLPFESLVGVVRVMEKGGSGYGGYRTWLPGIMFSRLFAAIMRHLIDWFVFVKDKDKESGEHPLCHVIANCMMLLTYINDKTFDDR